MTGRTRRLSIVCEPGGSNFWSSRVLRVAEDEDDLARLARVAATSSTWCDPIGAQPWAIESPERPRSTASGRSQPRYGPEEGVALRVEAGELGSEQAK